MTPSTILCDTEWRSRMTSPPEPSLNASPTLRTTRPRSPAMRVIDTGVSPSGLPRLRYRHPSQASVEGNTVDAQAEKARFVESAVRCQASLTFLNAKIRALRTAVCGE